jgi:DNA modification methylase
MQQGTPARPFNVIRQGHALVKLKELPDESVDCVVTSPPYYWLRKYVGAEQVQVWDGQSRCKHDWKSKVVHIDNLRFRNPKGKGRVGVHCNRRIYSDPKVKQAVCSKCRAWKGALGQEPTVILFIQHLIEIFREVRRVLKPTGTCHIVVADKYQKNKNLCLVPQRLAIGLQEDGWILRQLNFWVKTNPRPSSTLDSRTECVEHVWMLTKAAHYSYNSKAVREPNSATSNCHGGRNARNIITTKLEHLTYEMCLKCKHVYSKREFRQLKPIPGRTKNYSGGITAPNTGNVGERAKKSHVSRRCRCGANNWLYHSAIFPQALVQPLILSACPPGGIVLDCFFGAGTVGVVAERLGRKWIGIEVSKDYCILARERIRRDTSNPTTQI